MGSPAPERPVASLLPYVWPGLYVLGIAARAGGCVALRDDVAFSPGDDLHRGRIRATVGETWVTLPVRAAAPGTPLHAVELPPPSLWAPRVMRVIEHAFADAPFLEHYRCDLARLLFHAWPRLIDLSEEMLRLLLRAYGLPVEIVRASALIGSAPPICVAAPALHERVSDRSALELLLWHGSAARDLLSPPRRGRARLGTVARLAGPTRPGVAESALGV